jgi:hypothetical protein
MSQSITKHIVAFPGFSGTIRKDLPHMQKAGVLWTKHGLNTKNITNYWTGAPKWDPNPCKQHIAAFPLVSFLSTFSNEYMWQVSGACCGCTSENKLSAKCWLSKNRQCCMVQMPQSNNLVWDLGMGQILSFWMRTPKQKHTCNWDSCTKGISFLSKSPQMCTGIFQRFR